MLSEDFDKKIKLAAEQHHPAYDEKAWLKMEKLLGQYLPIQKKDRRRAFFLVLLFLLITGGGTFLVISKPWINKTHFSEKLSQGNKNKPQPKNIEKANNNNINFTNTEADKKSTGETTNEDLNTQSQKKENFTGKPLNHPFPDNKKIVQRSILKNQPTSYERRNEDVNENNKEKIEPVNSPASIPSDRATRSEKNSENKLNDSSPKKDEIKQNTNIPIAIEEIKEPTQKSKLKKKNAHLAAGQGFSFSISAGPDVSKASDSKTGKATLLYGAGIGYTKNRLTLRTGIYTSKKIYWAEPYDYKLSFPVPPSIEFEGADANCNVIEIPVKLSYNFGIKDRSNWFAGGGLSSYLMKSEKYTYIYKTASGSLYSHNYSTKNENKHYFSILNLSAGYSYKINNYYSVTAEPYAEIPLTGIGVGKVHLNSAGVLLTVGIHPFKK